MGGQACILYGVGEFSRDLDVVITTDRRSFSALQAALADLHATQLYLPALDLEPLERGHIAHVACQREGGLRLDICTRPPRVPDTEALWERAKHFHLPDGDVPVLSLQDLVATKKTQRDKDWAIIGRLVEVDMSAHTSQVTPGRLTFWLQEGRDAATLIGLSKREPDVAGTVAANRPALEAALSGDMERVELELAYEQIRGKRADEAYWQPLRAELERMRHQTRRS